MKLCPPSKGAPLVQGAPVLLQSRVSPPPCLSMLTRVVLCPVLLEYAHQAYLSWRKGLIRNKEALPLKQPRQSPSSSPSALHFAWEGPTLRPTEHQIALLNLTRQNYFYIATSVGSP